MPGINPCKTSCGSARADRAVDLSSQFAVWNGLSIPRNIIYYYISIICGGIFYTESFEICKVLVAPCGNAIFIGIFRPISIFGISACSRRSNVNRLVIAAPCVEIKLRYITAACIFNSEISTGCKLVGVKFSGIMNCVCKLQSFCGGINRAVRISYHGCNQLFIIRKNSCRLCYRRSRNRILRSNNAVDPSAYIAYFGGIRFVCCSFDFHSVDSWVFRILIPLIFKFIIAGNGSVSQNLRCLAVSGSISCH